MVKKGGADLNNVIQPYTGSNNGAQAALNDGLSSDKFHIELLQYGSGIKYPTFSGDPAATHLSHDLNETLILNVNNATGDITGGKKSKSKSKKRKSKSKKKKSKSKSKKRV